MLNFEPLMTLAVDVGPIVTAGHAPFGEARAIEIVGGTFEGARLSGEILPGGSDWQILHKDGTIDLDARYVLKERNGALIRVVSRGLRHGPPDVLAALQRGEDVDPSRYFFRTVLRFETGDAKLDWLNRTIGVATAARKARRVEITAYSLL